MGVKCFGLDVPMLGKGEVWNFSVGVLISAQHSLFPCKEPEHIRANSEPVTPSEDDIAEAERLKTEGSFL